MMGRTTNSAMFSGDVLGFFKRNLRFFTVFWGEFFFVKNNRIQISGTGVVIPLIFPNVPKGSPIFCRNPQG